MAEIELRDITKRFGELLAVDDVSMTARDGEFVCLLGPSGCGKTTTLRIIAGLETQSEGDVLIDGNVVNDLRPRDRDLAMVFQDNAVYPHLTVFENLAFPLRARKTPDEEIDEKVHEVATTLEIEDKLGDPPSALSGGQQQRVALGRAMIRSPQAFLMDEPLSDLDAKLRRNMRVEITQLHADLGTTTVYVTHDQIEAMTMADRIVLMRDGSVEQFGTPEEVYEKPATTWVGEFMGEPGMETFIAEVTGTTLTLGGGTSTVTLELSEPPDTDGHQEVILGIRPEHIGLEEDGLPTTVRAVEDIGDGKILHLETGGLAFVAKMHDTGSVEMGDEVRVAFTERLHLFDREGQILTRVTEGGPWVPRGETTAATNDD